MTVDTLVLRRGIMRLTNTGDSFSIAGVFPEIEAETSQFCRARRIPVRIEPTEGGAVITKVDVEQRGSGRYPTIAKLQPGEATLITVGPQEHQRVRVYVSQLGRKIGAVFRCTKSDNDILVKRVDGTEAEHQRARTSKYDLGRLATVRELRFDLPRADHHKLRLSVTSKARVTGWTIRCRSQDDGSMLVYRVDHVPQGQTGGNAAQDPQEARQ